MEDDRLLAFSNLDLRGAALEAQTPSVRFAFTFPELLAHFEATDAMAMRAKRSSRRLGYGAIVLVFAALVIVSAGGLLQDMGVAEHMVQLASAICGISGFSLGVWNMFPWSPRRRWLVLRTQTECMRNFHFTYIVERAADIVDASGNEAREAAYVAARLHAFGTLKQRLSIKRSDAFRRIIRSGEPHIYEDIIAAGAEPRATPALTDVFAAWRKIRLEWQISYCDAKLDVALRGGRMTPKLTERVFSAVSWAIVILILGADLVHLVPEGMRPSLSWLDFAVVVLALASLAARAVESGVACQREVERYEQYRSRLRVALRRFDRAESVAAKIETMRGSEELSFEEMVSFLRTQNQSQFIL